MSRHYHYLFHLSNHHKRANFNYLTNCNLDFQTNSHCDSNWFNIFSGTDISFANHVLPTATSLTCPAANGTQYIDTNRVQYSIRCNADNSYASFNSSNITTGGFSKCFPACDDFTACAGFTFVGTDSGICYFKSNLPDNGYSSTAGGNYVTVALLDRDAQVGHPANALPTNSSDISSGSNGAPIGAIIGGVIGGLALILLLALLVFFCLRRRRRQKEEIKSATQRFPQGACVPQPKSDAPFAALGGRSKRNTYMICADLYAGFYRGRSADVATTKQAPLDESQLAREDSANGFLAARYDKPAPTPAVYNTSGPSEVEGRPIYPPANVGPAPVEMDAGPIMSPKTPMSSQVDESPVLGRYTQAALTNRGQGSLADDIRKRQHSRHIMSWNNYDDRSAISPPSSMTMSPRIGSPDVSPLMNSSRDSTASKSPPERYRGHFI
ncbi:hypothetical protein E4T39_02922 [Aureobasidium subglaciale]|nr:hypothetical protein E4T39_02922 [Aureobasidium subglaciale]